ncbi:MAG: HD domain-containing protein [Oscillospiraceae bacterium]|nr:HD domain-containing protein [Oscillospiraceae bacterium]
MNAEELLTAMHVAERLKDTTRHCYTSGGRHESVAEHSWRLALLAFFLKSEFPEADMDRVVQMCLIHDLGEAFTGDIPTFVKTLQDEKREEALLSGWIASLPDPLRSDLSALYAEMDARETLEAKIFKALDGIEAIVQHNESDLSTWEPHEYELNLHYADDRVSFSPVLTALRESVRAETKEKLRQAEPALPRLDGKKEVSES